MQTRILRNNIALLATIALLGWAGFSTQSQDQPQAGVRASVGQLTNPEAPMTEAERQVNSRNKATMLRIHQEVWTLGNTNAIPSLYATNFVCQFGEDRWVGHEGIVAAVTGHRGNYPNWKEEPEILFGEENWIASVFWSTGTHSGKYEPKLAGREIRVREIAVHRFNEEGKMEEQIALIDFRGWDRQLKKDLPAEGEQDDSQRQD